MRIKLNTLILLLSTLFLTFGLTSCDDDGYSLGDQWIETVTVHTYENGEAEYFTCDDGKTLFVAAQGTRYKPAYERVTINYTILGDNYEGFDHAIKLNYYIYDILTKPIIYVAPEDEQKQNEIGNDKITIQAASASGGYIDLRFFYAMGGKDSHLVNLVAEDKSLEQDGDNPIKLKFRHNKRGDEELYYSTSLYASFKIDNYITANEGKDKLTFEISWDDNKGETKSTIVTHSLSSTK